MVNREAMNLSGYFILGAVLLFFVAIQFFDTPFSFTGRGIRTDNAVLNVSVMAPNKIIDIYSPLNITYNFSRSDPFLIPLNVTAEFIADSWRYSLYDDYHSSWVYQNVPFVPNSSISAVRRLNKLRVEAHEVDGNWYWARVYFFVYVNDSSPIISNISDQIYVCEGDPLYVPYNGTDLDEDQLTTSITSPNPFFVAFVSYDGNQTTFFRLVSAAITKAQAGGVGGIFKSYFKTITIADIVPLIDTADVNITAIEVNERPVIENQLGAQTVWTKGDNSTFYHQYDVSDTEDGITADGNLYFNLSFSGASNVFDINSSYGIMNFSPTEDLAGDIYNLQACVTDNPLNESHQNFSVCEANGHRNSSWTVCDTFSLTITNQNRPPEITNYTPYSDTLFSPGTSAINFFAEVRDPDGTIPDIDWYVDGNMVEHNENESNDTIAYAFGCEVSGLHNVSVFTTDGLLNDSIVWNVSVGYVECPIGASGGGGGGGVSAKQCYEDWQCGDWDVCQNAQRSYNSGILAIEDYNYISGVCAQNGYDDVRFCGFQVKSCVDINGCHNPVLRVEPPGERQICYFTENPSCSDGITNCHDGGCETLVDCGGPCGKCATCSDGIQNQGEEGKDCGGPCPYVCEEEIPFRTVTIVLLTLSGILVLVILVYFVRLLIITRRRNKDREAMLRAQGIKR